MAFIPFLNRAEILSKMGFFIFFNFTYFSQTNKIRICEVEPTNIKFLIQKVIDNKLFFAILEVKREKQTLWLFSEYYCWRIWHKYGPLNVIGVYVNWGAIFGQMMDVNCVLFCSNEDEICVVKSRSYTDVFALFTEF